MTRQALIILAVFVIPPARAQVSLQSVLDSIAANNLYIQASSLNRDAEAINARTGIHPSDPEVEYGYFPGNTSALGVKTTLNVSQSFSFPSVYARKIDAARLTGNKSDEVHRGNRRQVLLEAATRYMDLVYLNQYISELTKRSGDAYHVNELIEKSLIAGDANQLEVNRARLEALRWNNELNVHLARRAETEQLLVSMNNGRLMALSGAVYPEGSLPMIDSVIYQVLRNDPVLLALEYDQQIALNNVKLQQSLWLPQFSAGYGQEITAGDAYRGVQAGISIPLWQNRNTIKVARLQQLSLESGIKAYRQQLHSDISAKYRVIEALRNNYEAYKKTMESVKSQELLKKSLDTGNISVLEYYRDLLPWYEMVDEYLQSAREYYLELIQLMVFEW